MKALVTGGTGMLGSHVVERLLAEGVRVRALVREPSRALWLARQEVELVRGDLLDPVSLRTAARGCDEVYHAAAVIGAGDGWETFKRGNVDGTRALVEAAGEAGARMVHVSSTAVFGRHRFFAHPTDETVPLPELPAEDAYGRSKQEAERVVLEAHEQGTIHGVVVRPPVMYGLRDRQFIPRLGAVLSRGVVPLPAAGRARMTLVHGDAVARGMILAARTPEAGGRVYHLTDDFPVTVREMAEWAAEGLDAPVRLIPVPGPVARVGFGMLQAGLVATGRGELARHAPGMLSMLTRDNPFSSERARSELGWEPRLHPRDGLPAAVAEWRERQGGVR